MKKIFFIFTSILLSITLTFTTPAQENPITENYTDDIYSMPVVSNEGTSTNLEIKAKSCFLLEAKTNTVLYKNNEKERLAPASITKIMSILLVLEKIEQGYFNLGTKITASEYACSMGGSQIWLEPNETMTVDELLRATIIASANDATVALAEAVSGSEEAFVNLMNEKAEKLDMKNTYFKNATGLDEEGHYSSAEDIAIMSAELIKHELVKKYSTVWMDALRNGESELVNTNKLVRYYEGCTGLKTGTTGNAGYCLSATAQRNNMELVAVVLDGATSNDRFNGARKLLDYGFANYSFLEIKPNLSLLKEIPCKNGLKNTLNITANKSLNLLLKKSTQKDVVQSVNIPSYIKAPISQGDVVGKYDIAINGKTVGNIDIVADENIAELNFFSAILILLNCILLP